MPHNVSWACSPANTSRFATTSVKARRMLRCRAGRKKRRPAPAARGSSGSAPPCRSCAPHRRRRRPGWRFHIIGPRVRPTVGQVLGQLPAHLRHMDIAAADARDSVSGFWPAVWMCRVSSASASVDCREQEGDVVARAQGDALDGAALAGRQAGLNADSCPPPAGWAAPPG